MQTNLTFHPQRPCQSVTEHVGREQLEFHAFSRLGTNNLQSFAVIGGEKMGKTSFLWHLQQEAILSKHLSNTEKYHTVFLDAAQPPLDTEQRFFTQFYKKLKQLIEIDDLENSSDLYKVTDYLSEHQEKLILLIDNFNLVVTNAKFSITFYESLRSWFSTHAHIACIVTSPMKLDALSVPKQLSGSPFFNIFTSYVLTPFKLTEATALFESRLPENLQQEPKHILHIIEQMGLTPYPLHQAGLCYLRQVDKTINLKQVINDSYQACLPYYENLYAEMSQEQLNILSCLLNPQSENPKHIPSILIEQGWVSKEGEIKAKQFARFLANKLGLSGNESAWQRLLQVLGLRRLNGDYDVR